MVEKLPADDRRQNRLEAMNSCGHHSTTIKELLHLDFITAERSSQWFCKGVSGVFEADDQLSGRYSIKGRKL